MRIGRGRLAGAVGAVWVGTVMLCCGGDDEATPPGATSSPDAAAEDGGGGGGDAAVPPPDADPGPFTTWRLVRDPTTLDEAEEIAVSAGHAFFAGADATTYFVEARNAHDGAFAWRQDVTNESLVATFDDDVLVAMRPINGPSTFERRRGADGTVAWSKAMPSDVKAIDVTPDGIFGLFGADGALASDKGFLVGRYDRQTGAKVWEAGSNPTPYVDGAAALRATSKAVYVAGVRKNGGPPYSLWHVEKRDLASGTAAWAKPFTLAAEQTNNSATAIDSDDVGVYVAGYMYVQEEDAGLAERTVVVRLDAATGNEVWHVTVPFGSNYAGYGRAPRLVAGDDAIYVADANREGEAVVAKLAKADGKAQWTVKSFPQQRVTRPVAVARSGGALYLAGRTQVPDAGTSETILQVEKRDLRTGAFDPTHHVEHTK